MHFVQSMQRTQLLTRPFVCGIYNLLKLGVCASRNQVLMHVWQEPEYRIDVCHVTHGAHIEDL